MFHGPSKVWAGRVVYRASGADCPLGDPAARGRRSRLWTESRGPRSERPDSGPNPRGLSRSPCSEDSAIDGLALSATSRLSVHTGFARAVAETRRFVVNERGEIVRRSRGVVTRRGPRVTPRKQEPLVRGVWSGVRSGPSGLRPAPLNSGRELSVSLFDRWVVVNTGGIAKKMSRGHQPR